MALGIMLASLMLGRANSGRTEALQAFRLWSLMLHALYAQTAGQLKVQSAISNLLATAAISENSDCATVLCPPSVVRGAEYREELVIVCEVETSQRPRNFVRPDAQRKAVLAQEILRDVSAKLDRALAPP